ncbi:MAG: Xaa-Pro peptidase family protein [Ardenticatenaceae bacterium]|nr:Xaa-Pro peptidase family protein [Ardenticatenaceae bacterium]HBY96055.1 hypothetical protein [Chloroflexota bacterium]
MNEPFGNLERLNTFLADSDFDVVVAVSPENVPYTSGVFIWSQRGIRDRLALTVWPKSGKPTLIVCNIEEPQTREETFIKDLRSYEEFRTSPIELLADVVKEKGLAKGHIGIEMRYLSAHYWEQLRSLLPQATFDECDDLFAQVRMIKTEREIEVLTQAARGTERALLATCATIHKGETEKSMAQRLADNILLTGAGKVEFLYINAGPNTGYPHCDAASYQCRVGDIIKADCGGLYAGFTSDVARTAVIGRASNEQQSIYNRLVDVHQECLATARVGNRASDIFEVMKKGHERVKLPFPLPHAGHSTGLTAHEPPILNPFDHTVLQPNMMLYIETRVRWPGREGYHIEDLVLLTNDGPKIMTGAFNTSILFEI